MMKKKTLTSPQKTTLSQIVKRAMPTEKQLQYLKNLGYEGEVKTKKEASEKISELKEMIE
mgnify:CR=1 FL=1